MQQRVFCLKRQFTGQLFSCEQICPCQSWVTKWKKKWKREKRVGGLVTETFKYHEVQDDVCDSYGKHVLDCQEPAGKHTSMGDDVNPASLSNVSKSLFYKTPPL